MLETRTIEENYDVVVVGGGPGGSTAAALVARAGHSVLLLEKEVFPRYQIGESLLPGTVHGICKLLGVLPELQGAGFMPKLGGTFRWGVNEEPWSFLFSNSPVLTPQNSAAFQVERMRFDDILLRNAARSGAVVREGVSVSGVIEQEGRVTGVRWTDTDGAARVARAGYVVDASGNRSSLYKSVGERRYSEFFQNLALFGYYEGGKRLSGPSRGNILCAAFDEGWFWYIPLSETLTSVGAVVRREYAATLQADPEAAMDRFIAACPMVADYLKDAKRVRDGVYGQLRVRKDYSYSMDKFWRPGLALVGDAACFIDPVFSTGVHLATYSGLLAARSINTCLAGDLTEERVFTEFDERYRREYRVFYEFLAAFYDMNATEDSYFWNAKKVSGMGGTELEAFASLVGGTTAEAELLLTTASRQLAEAVSGDQGQPVGGEEGAQRFFNSPVVLAARQGMRSLQASLGAEGSGPEAPVLDGGLIPSRDQLHWLEAAAVS